MDQSRHDQPENQPCQSNQNQATNGDAGDELELPRTVTSSILGLKLNLTQEFVDLCSNLLRSKQNQTGKRKVCDDRSTPHQQKKRKVQLHESKAQATFDKERQKACNFNARQITIGKWKFTTQRGGDFMVKFYFCKRKLVWEFLKGNLKKKMDFPWSDITAIKADFGKGGQEDSLYIKLGKPPVFSNEVDPKPRKHTNWEPSVDFTYGEASANRMHHVLFAAGSLQEPYKRLMQADERLHKLDKQPFQRDVWCPEDNNCLPQQVNALNLKRIPAPVPNLSPGCPNAVYNQFTRPESLSYEERRRYELQRHNSIRNEKAELNTPGTTQDQLNMPLSYMNGSFSYNNAQNHEKQGYMVHQGNNMNTMTTQEYQFQSQGQFNSNSMQSSQFEHYLERSLLSYREPNLIPHDEFRWESDE